ncbi:MAG: iron chaperone [Candidatus Limnocylindria bacterium]
MAERKPAVKDTKKSAKSTTAIDKPPGRLTDEERAALKETLQERKRQTGESDLLAKIAEMPEQDRAMAKRIHAIVKASAPDLSPKTWYGMPAYANKDGKIVCFFQAADKFKARYATFGFDQAANLDEGAMWPTSWALTALTDADEATIAALVKKAAH